MTNIEKDYSCRKVDILSYSEAAVEALGSSQIIITFSGPAINP